MTSSMTKYINSCIKLLFIYSLFSELLYSYYSVSLLFTIPDLLLLAAAVIVFCRFLFCRENKS